MDVAPEIPFQPMSLSQMAEHTASVMIDLGSGAPSDLTRKYIDVEDLLSNEDAMTEALQASTARYQVAFLRQFDFLQQRILYTGLGFLAAVFLISSIMYSRAVCSLGYRARLLLQAVVMIPRKIARIVQEDAQRSLNMLLEDVQEDDVGIGAVAVPTEKFGS